MTCRRTLEVPLWPVPGLVSYSKFPTRLKFSHFKERIDERKIVQFKSMALNPESISTDSPEFTAGHTEAVHPHASFIERENGKFILHTRLHHNAWKGQHATHRGRRAWQQECKYTNEFTSSALQRISMENQDSEKTYKRLRQSILQTQIERSCLTN